MGSLTLPASGQVYVETPILIYSVERHPTYGPLLDSLWQAAQTGQITPVSSTLIITEVLVMPLRRGDVGLQAVYEAALFQADLYLLPLTPDVLREAARLRAALPGMRTPDSGASPAYRWSSWTTYWRVDFRRGVISP